MWGRNKPWVVGREERCPVLEDTGGYEHRTAWPRSVTDTVCITGGFLAESGRRSSMQGGRPTVSGNVNKVAKGRLVNHCRNQILRMRVSVQGHRLSRAAEDGDQTTTDAK